MSKEYDILVQFDNQVTKTSKLSNLYSLKYNWENFKHKFDMINDSKISYLYKEIEHKLTNKIKELEKKNKYDNAIVSEKYNCSNNKSLESQNEIYRVIDKTLSYFINEYKSLNIESDVSELYNFLNWVANISQCYEILHFRPKFIELEYILMHIYNSDYNLKNDFKNLFKKIKYTKNNSIENNIMIGSFLNKKFRNCSLLDKEECNEECYLSTGVLDYFRGSRCKNADIKKLLFNTYCSVGSYKTKEEIIILIKLFSDDLNNKYTDDLKNLLSYSTNKIVVNDVSYNLDKLSNEKLCKVFKQVLDSKLSDLGKIDSYEFLNKYNMSSHDIEEAFYRMRDMSRRKYKVYEMITGLYNWIKNNKKKVYFISGLVLLLIIYYFVVPAVRSSLGYDNPDDEIIVNQDLYDSAQNLLSNLNKNINIDQSIPENIIDIIKSNGHVPEIVAGNDNFLSIDEYNNYINFVDIKNNLAGMESYSKNFCEHLNVCEGNKGIVRDDMPQIMTKSINDYLSDINYFLEKIATETNESLINKYQGTVNYFQSRIDSMRAYGLEDVNFNPYEAISDFLGYNLKKGVSIEAGMLTPTQNEIYIDKTLKMADSYLKNQGNNYFTEAFPVIKEKIGETIKYYILDGHHRWSSAITIGSQTSVTVDIIELNPGESISQFITNTFNIPGVFRENLQGNLVL